MPNDINDLELRELARIANVTIQDFMIRNDSTCGNTIGPLLSAKLDMETVDLGTLQLSTPSSMDTERLPHGTSRFCI
jgi:aspartyl aminopeptidase